MVEPIEETMIIPEKFEDFRVYFSHEYKKLAHLLNESPNSYKKTVVLTHSPEPVFNFGFEWSPKIVKYAFFGEDSSSPYQIGLGLYYPGKQGEIIVLSQSPNSPFVLSIDSEYFLASISSGEQSFHFRLMQW